MIETIEEVKEPTTEVAQGKPSTNYATIMSNMTPEVLAGLGVRLISVNSNELYWVTTKGQLYGFNAQNQAIKAEYDWLMSEPEEQ